MEWKGREGKGREWKGREGLGDVFFFHHFSLLKNLDHYFAAAPLFCRGPILGTTKKRVFSFRRKAKQSNGEIVVEEIAG